MPEAIQKYRLCETCLRRQGGGAGDFEIASDDDCFICQGLVKSVSAVVSRVIKSARSYEFGTFAIGLSMPDGVQEREDELRSTMKLKGKETLKLQLSATISREVSKALGKKVFKEKPDLTLIVNLPKRQVEVFSKPLFFFARYTKPSGITQRMGLCRACRGRGCETCKNSGLDQSPSVEKLVRRKLAVCGSDNMVFTWIGSEDAESEVFPPGRPFVVEIKNPMKRRPPGRFVVGSRGRRVRVNGGRILPSKPRKLPSFRFETRISARSSTTVDRESVRELQKQFHDATVQFDRPYDKPVFKRVNGVRAKVNGQTLVIDAKLDGGLPVKRFVSGDLVSPSVSEVLKTDVRCQKFDIRRVIETSEFEFA